MEKVEKRVSVCRIKKGKVLKKLRNGCLFVALRRGKVWKRLRNGCLFVALKRERCGKD